MITPLRCAVVQRKHSCGSLGSDTAYKQWGLTCQTEGASSSRLTLRRVASGSGLGSSVLTGRGRGQGSLLDQPTSSYPLQSEGAMRPSASALCGCSGHTICHHPRQPTSVWWWSTCTCEQGSQGPREGGGAPEVAPPTRHLSWQSEEERERGRRGHIYVFACIKWMGEPAKVCLSQTTGLHLLAEV